MPGAVACVDDAALDREDAVRPAAGAPGSGRSSADGDVDSGVVDRAELRVRPRVEECPAHGMLLMLGRHRPAAKVVVVALRERRHRRCRKSYTPGRQQTEAPQGAGEG